MIGDFLFVVLYWPLAMAAAAWGMVERAVRRAFEVHR